MRLRLCSYNIRKAVGLDWRRDPERVLSILRDIRPDIAVLQEADRRLGPRHSVLPAQMVAELTGLVPVVTPGSEVSMGWHGNALLMRPGIDLIGLDGLVLPGLEPRGALIADVDVGGAHLALAAVHLGLRRANRLIQLDTVVERLKETRASARLIAGDWNEWRANGVPSLGEDYRILTPGPSFHARAPMAALDRVAISGRIRERSMSVWTEGAARIASDHLPIVVDLHLD
ncbi:hypothetical protein OCGS_1968 [Oceaniovalibus guishaninsula JLT2003]|uniref:Endonuclease/exonuclease/phosphatase domain-containing protein n=1 Tax=Oceaniovalibus guishaninsula JLT2003 TaxID=1231392 RepID=K2HBI9_9RHOB|nr:endonuclease/exonuclease/phosphatase family protein [Oceaniovalibus guishaninsula]EKE43987.1 hypothetical protein OCGS_1968 [Oceaniovalibus guishaninsula JLT2003]